MALMHSEEVEVRNMNVRDKPPAGAAAEKGTSLIVGNLPLPSVSRPAPIDNISDVPFSSPQSSHGGKLTRPQPRIKS